MRPLIIPVLLFCLFSISILTLSAQDTPDPASLALANKILAKMSVEQKVSLCHGNGTMSINAIPEIGLPDEFWMDDGPSGVRAELARKSFNAARADTDHSDESTALPRGCCLAATWDRDFATQYGQVLGEECRARGKDMLLGPAVNIVRTPLCGRNHEYFGEDPYLSSQIAVGYINGLQSRNVAACVKHFAMNNQELARMSVDVEAGDRAAHEIYLPAFEAAVKQAHVLSVMGAYNRFRGSQCCESDLLLNQILKRDWSFPGFVVSDWGGAHDTLKSALGGLDLEMNSGSNIHVFTEPLLAAVKSGAVPMATLDDKVRRILYVMAKIHKIDGQSRFAGSINTAAHQELARKVAEAGVVLLKNDKHLLPIDLSQTKSILVIGYNATYKNNLGGASASGKAPYEVTAWQGLLTRFGSKVKLDLMDHVPDPTGTFSPAVLAERAKSYDLVLFFTGDYYGDRFPGTIPKAENSHALTDGLGGEGREGEGSDRTNMMLPAGMDDDVKAVLAANPHTVVINQSGTPVEMPWADQASTLVQYWFSGMEGGNAIAAVLAGDVNPSGKLPVTFPRQLSDTPADTLHDYNGKKEAYAEGVLVGYRWYDAKSIAPLFPFGYGLSYTTFSISDLKLSAESIHSGEPVTVTATVTNSGRVPGAEVVQLYVGDSSAAVMRPPKELKGFQKVTLQPGESKAVQFDLDSRAFSYWDEKAGDWKIDPGLFQIRVGTSSRDLPLEKDLAVK